MTRAETTAPEVLRTVLRESGLSKTEVCARAGISRALFDDYLRGAKQPSVAQVERIADAAGFRVQVRLSRKPRPVSAEYIAVMQMAGELAGKRDRLPPLRFPHHLWRRAL